MVTTANTFFDGLTSTSRILIDSSASGSLQTKTTAKALALIKLIAKNQYMNTSERNTVKKGVMEVEIVNALMAQLSTMNKKLEKLEPAVMGTQISCGLCGGPHENHNCILVQDDQSSIAQLGRQSRAARAMDQPQFSKTTTIPFTSTAPEATESS
ncbi:hypothetical protein PIB30_084045 [Stylosanthes scabra]|uniref:Uncharacterized protein n=1 Tax=Stylosanthes scabra TaxID=79078 RepID=A0ABU6YRZ0_9FABA|nr:hypothetical protein [Stylosanthes scabra]